MAASNSDRFIVRAEIRALGECVTSYGFDLTASSIFVVTEWNAPIGTQVSLRLSFPRVLEPIDIAAKIGDIRVPGEPGEPGGSGWTSTRAPGTSPPGCFRCSITRTIPRTRPPVTGPTGCCSSMIAG